jgi:hypothetical protein
MDFYPEENYEKVFGVEMVQGYTPPDVRDLWIGKLTYCVWQTLFKNDVITEQKLIDALWNHNLPQFFEQNVRQVYDEYIKPEGNINVKYMTTYVPELLRRGFTSIPWDLEVHQLLFKKNNSTKGFPGELISGLKVVGDQLIPERIQMDSSFEKCPIAVAAGIPLFVKKVQVPKQHLVDCDNYIIVRMMSEPNTGMAPFSWTYGGLMGPAPPVLVARSDAIAFTKEDWKVLDEFEMKMLNDGPRAVTRKDFLKFAKKKSGDANVILEALFPKNQRVRIVELKKNVALNDKMGQVIGDYGNGRVGIKMKGVDNIIAVKPTNLKKIS